MTTDNTQELDEIFYQYGRQVAESAVDDWGKHEALTEFTELDMANHYTEAKQAILDWHNKQVEEVLDRLQSEQRAWMHEHAELKLGYATYLLSNIEAERNKLKEENQ